MANVCAMRVGMKTDYRYFAQPVTLPALLVSVGRVPLVYPATQQSNSDY